MTEWSMPPNFGACCTILEKSIYYVEFLVPEAIAQICFVNKVFCKISKRAFFPEDLRWLLLWFIFITSIVVTWVSWFSGQKFKLEAENFYLRYSPQKCSKFWCKNTCFVVSQKFSVISFFLMSLSAGIYLIKLWSCSKFG